MPRWHYPRAVAKRRPLACVSHARFLTGVPYRCVAVFAAGCLLDNSFGTIQDMDLLSIGTPQLNRAVIGRARSSEALEPEAKLGSLGAAASPGLLARLSPHSLSPGHGGASPASAAGTPGSAPRRLGSGLVPRDEKLRRQTDFT